MWISVMLSLSLTEKYISAFMIIMKREKTVKRKGIMKKQKHV